ncbi:SEC-C metal-binding domain-containing protein [uncultured Desulfobacter sp.]|uniref:YecA family protein n=1 Tax=uncultured Desulfobacter sp. TaxID=240139 RepID=UPI0029C96FAB|nr:SEC-C metal-binding domain-containing protein [uncultured Desulfobacter sp.]
MKKNKIGRNDPCLCGSGKKYKKCCHHQKFDFEISDNNVPPVKISEAILKISEPLRRNFPKRERISVIISMAILAWNMSLTSEDAREDMENKIVEMMPKEIDAIGLASIVEQIDILIQRKVEYYNNVKFLIKGHNLYFNDDDQVTLDISSVYFDGN